jgi:hypothetical protein
MPIVGGIELDVQAFVICDSVVRDAQTGKTSVQGIFDTIFTPAFPCMHPLLAAYFRLRFDKPPTFSVNAALQISAPSGLRNTSPSIAMSMQPGTVGMEGTINVQGMQFVEAGQYTIDLLLNSEAVADYPLTVQLVGVQARGTGRLLN